MRKWIVLVDDDLDMHYIYQKVFEKLGLGGSLKFFENGEDALGYLTTHSHEVKIIFSDINMPVMDGLQLKRSLNNSCPECKLIPFIFLSTSAQEKEVREAYELMVQGFFQKGLTLHDIEQNVRAALDYWGNCVMPDVHPAFQ